MMRKKFYYLFPLCIFINVCAFFYFTNLYPTVYQTISGIASANREISKDREYDHYNDNEPNKYSHSILYTDNRTIAKEIKPNFQDQFLESDNNDEKVKEKFIFPYMLHDADPEVPFENDENKLTLSTLYQLKLTIRCHNRDYFKQFIPRGDYWVLKNFVKAEHGQISCYKSVTLATHATLTYLDNVEPLVERWMSPISLAIYAPGKDFIPTVQSIWYLRECLQTDIIKQYVTFHIFFHSLDTPDFGNQSMISYLRQVSDFNYDCSDAPYFVNETYRSKMRLYYPVNLARNIARDAALTHFILSSDIELFPSPNIVPKFLNMVAREHGLQKLNDNSSPKVFALSIFQVTTDFEYMPWSKTVLEEMLLNASAVWFSRPHCPFCHLVPNGLEWLSEKETPDMFVFDFTKRQGKYMDWQPVFIGTHFDPHFDERLSWEGKNDRVTQSYLLCVLDYEIILLSNAFLIHKTEFKKNKNITLIPAVVKHESKMIRTQFLRELNTLYGFSNSCAL